MTEKQTLSDKIIREWVNTREDDNILVKDVKEFIKELKEIKINILEATGRLSKEHMLECYEKEIDKLAGEELSE